VLASRLEHRTPDLNFDAWSEADSNEGAVVPIDRTPGRPIAGQLLDRTRVLASRPPINLHVPLARSRSFCAGQAGTSEATFVKVAGE
jgi:hypothetical protein